MNARPSDINCQTILNDGTIAERRAPSARRKHVGLWIVGLTLAFLAPSLASWQTAYAQQASVEVAAAVDDVARVLEQGAMLERDRRWAEAMNHYESALKLHPGRPDLVEKHSLARAHYDVSRRYSDQSFTNAIRVFTERDALAVLEEVLEKVHTHYVTPPNWQQVLSGGSLNVEVALSEPDFLKHNNQNISKSQQQWLTSEVRRMAREITVQDRAQLLQAIATVAHASEANSGVSPASVVMEYTSAATAMLDDYSSFLTGQQMDEVFSQIEGNFVGLGVELKTEPAGLLIVNVIPGGPAEQGGIRAGDRIVEVDNHTVKTATPDQLADMLRGAENSLVRVVLQDSENRLRELRLARKRVEVPSVDEVKMLDTDRGVGYFRITSFQKTTSRDVDAALWKLHDQGMRSLVIDLRGNPGGLLKASVDVADKFVMDGLIVATRGRSAREDFDHKGQVVGTWRVPLVLLIDGDSASASEILAGAVRDHRRGTVVGETSYGKGSVQGIFPLTTANLGVRLTTAKWYTPAGHAISGHGITPDITVRTTAKPVNGKLLPLADDAILRAALQVARSQSKMP